MLFVVYINDMPDIKINFTQMFADDTKIYASVKNTEHSRFLQNDINRLEGWAIMYCATIELTLIGLKTTISN